MSLTGKTALVVADGVVVVRVDGGYSISVGARQLHGDRYSMAILDVYSTAKTLQQGLDELEGRIRGTTTLIDLVTQVNHLYKVGVLRDPDASTTTAPAHEKRFDSAPVHIRMLNDRARTLAFQSAIRATVRPDDVVLDIGTGTGVLAVTAALAGARHVYAIEATGMSEVARRVAEANGVADRVSIIQGYSLDVDLPEKAHVLVSEIIGDDPLGERIVATFADARDRLLVDDARVIPSRLTVHALPLEVPVSELDRIRFSPERAQAWTASYGLDLRVLASALDGRALRHHVNSHHARGWTRLAGPVPVADVDLGRALPQQIDHEATFLVTATGSATGVLLLFEAELATGVRLSVHPDAATPDNSWGSLLIVLAEPRDLRVGDRVHLRYRFDERGSKVELT